MNSDIKVASGIRNMKARSPYFILNAESIKKTGKNHQLLIISQKKPVEEIE